MSEMQIIGERYELTGWLGQGGMATVYHGRDLQTGSEVAVKLMKREVIEHDPDLIERFVREGEALRLLNHPNIVKMLAMIVENDHHYAVMEYVSGGDLRTLMETTHAKDEQLSVRRIMEIAL
ncbi:MAG TPA: protein kinase, partial [Phototrophicaceae bacterium]|nr:protein kinase [Phototrophicaceae bacterium]